jgi:hypothetical protein
MEPRFQRLLLVLLIFVLTIDLYRDFGHEGTIRRLAHAASLDGGDKIDEQTTALAAANATLGARTRRYFPILPDKLILTNHFPSSAQSLQSHVNNQHVAKAFSSPPTSQSSTSRFLYSLFGPTKTSRNCALITCQVSREDQHWPGSVISMHCGPSLPVTIRLH